jgi:hypothetical protein
MEAGDQAAPAAPGAAPAQPAQQPTVPAAEIAKALNIVVGQPTEKFEPWQQIPAWVLGAAAIIAGGFLLAWPPSEGLQESWAAVIVTLFLAVILSYRSKFSLGTPDQPATGADTGGGGGGAQPPGNPPQPPA